ncbi:hypothetical protein ACFYMX_36720 [Streptomyces griseofuscus]|uniref:Uncharacterized protein n=1 Tax=Streptomyces griseofuscus TaxID=146922 RepID=A0A7H1PRH9_9ACTN|nr:MULTISPECIES: hypothetical protein [Streptomyces]BBC91509.1 hypothetical protein SRO_0333 [Streptomyces rochei]MBA9050234.1 hypothetical protein [Streptomyces murinus]MBJ6998624.1 hypothetical protein [Streptomyces sp. CRPSP2-6A1]MYQ94391.1 hypothetical protein [Streptomyces sp. SID4946]QNT90659.1 hypothetical protein HEP81_00322 [Streptomyces griseofuscus]
MATVAELQPDPNREVRIVSYRQSSSGVYHDGIVRSVTCANADENLYAVTLYRPAYNNESTCYVYGTDQVTEPTRTAAPANTERSYADRQRAFDRQNAGLPPEDK